MNTPTTTADPLLRILGVSKAFSLPGVLRKPKSLHFAVDDVSVELKEAEILGIVGESGCGKSTLTKLVLGILSPTSGTIELRGVKLEEYDRRERAMLMQPVFQDPYSSLNPRRRIYNIIRQPLEVHQVGSADERDRAVKMMMSVVGLPARVSTAYPSQLSGGQRQRVAIARALVLRPRIVVCDEPTSALDVSVQAQVINLLMDLRREFDVALLFVSHDLAIVRHISDNIAVMKEGRIIEYGTRSDVFERPKQAYTRTLLDSILKLPSAA